MARGKGTRGRGGRGASTSKVGTRANPKAMQDEGEQEETERQQREQLTPSYGSGGARAGENGAGGGDKHGTKRKHKDESDDEDWGLEGKSFWKSKIPQSVDTAEYIHEQLAPQFKKNIWEYKYCAISLFLPRDKEMRSGESW
jgi:hypothetical protein